MSLCKEYKTKKVILNAVVKTILSHQVHSAKSNILKYLDKMFSAEAVSDATNELTELDSQDKKMILRDILDLKLGAEGALS